MNTSNFDDHLKFWVMEKIKDFIFEKHAKYMEINKSHIGASISNLLNFYIITQKVHKIYI